MAARPFPSILVPSQASWNPRSMSRTGGQSIEGDEMIVASPTARWRASETYPCKTRDTVLAMRTVVSYGRAQTWLVGPRECYFAPRTATGAVPGVTVSSAAAMNATRLVVTRNASVLFAPGMTFSIGNRLHRIVELPFGDDGAASSIAMNIRPWLRASYPVGTPVEFGKPVGIMRFASDDTAEMMMALERFGEVQVDWIEAPSA